MKKSKIQIIVIIICAIVIRIILATLIKGFEVDINCFSIWAMRALDVSASEFYAPDYFCDYLPGYIIILNILAIIKDMFLISESSAIWVLLLKTPAIIADILISVLAYKIAKKKLAEKQAFIILIVTAFNPLLIFNSSVWGQVDSILILLILCTFYLYFTNKKIWAGLVYGISILIKTQSLMIGPILAIIYIYDVFKNRDLKSVKNGFFAALAAVGAILLISFPYRGDQEFFWVIDKLFSAASGYAYITINAANLWLPTFGNWASIEQTFFAIKAITFGMLGILLSFVFSVFVFVKNKIKNNGVVLFITAIFLFAVYMIGPYMHERYLMAVPFIFLFAFIELKNKHFLWMSALTTIICLANSIIVFVAYDTENFTNLDTMLTHLSYFAIVSFVLTIILTIRMAKKAELSIFTDSEPTQAKK